MNINKTSFWTTFSWIIFLSFQISLYGNTPLSFDDNMELSAIACPELQVDISTACLQHCAENQYFINYCNIGGMLVEGATVELTLDAFLSVMSTSIPITSQVDNVLTFTVGDLNPADCGTFQLTAFLDCDAVVGQAHCVEAQIFPDSLCLTPDPDWDESLLEVDFNCDGDSIFFEILNTGDGDMNNPSQFYIIIDDAMVYLNDFQLQSGQSTTIGVPTTGGTFHFQAIPSAGYPESSFAGLTVENCQLGANFTTGFFTQFPQNGSNPSVQINCQESTDTCTFNNKTTFPEGLGEEHKINANQPINYQINFQNTTNATLPELVICDTLSPFLDPTTVVAGASSHPYTVQVVNGNILKFTFANINLPDSTNNFANSYGFVEFTIKQQPDNPPGTVIENEAVLIFDNESEITNEVFHTIAEPIVTITEIEACEEYDYFGMTITENTTFQDTIEFPLFSSILITEIKINQPEDSFIVDEICDGDFYEIDGQFFTETDVYLIEVENPNGCIDIITLDLTVLPNAVTNLNEIISTGETFTVGNQTFSESGDYVIDLPAENGCDSTIFLSLFVDVPMVVCPVFAGDDTLVCGFQSTLVGSPTGGEWNVICDSAPADVAFVSVNDMTAEVTVSECGEYLFTYTANAVDSMGNNCVGTDTIRVLFEDPSNRNISQNTGLDLIYNDYDCPQGGEAFCSNSFSVSGAAPSEIWKFTVDGNCLSMIYSTTASGTQDECVIGQIDISNITFTADIPSSTYCVSQDAFITLDNISNTVIGNNFFGFIDSLVSLGITNVDSICPPPPSCGLSLDCMPVDTIIGYDTLEWVIPIHFGGNWVLIDDNNNQMTLTDTTEISINNDPFVVIILPSSDGFNATFELWRVTANGNLIMPPPNTPITVEWVENWGTDTITQIIAISEPDCPTCPNDTFAPFTLGEIPTTPSYNCDPITITFGSEMFVDAQVFDCNDEDYTVFISIFGGVPPYTIEGLSGFFDGSNSFISDPIPIYEPYFATIFDAAFCVETIDGDVCPCTTSFIGFSGNTTIGCVDDCTTLSVNDVGNDIDYSWFFNGTVIGNQPQIEACEAGTYLVVLTHIVSGCASSGTIEVEKMEGLEIDAGEEQTLTCFTPDATLQGTGLSGANDLIFNWEGPGIDNNNVNLQNPTVNESGWYLLTITDEQTGCMGTDEVFVINDTTPPIADAGADLEEVCATDLLTLNGENSSSANELAFTWFDANDSLLGIQPILPTNLTGVFILKIQDIVNGCEATDTVQIAPFEAVEMEVKTFADCWNDESGSVQIINSDSLASTTFSLNNQDFQDVPFFENLENGDYTLYRLINEGCLDSLNFSINEIPALPDVDLENEYHICGADEVLELNASINFDPNSVSYLWSNGDTTASTNYRQAGDEFVEIATQCETKVIDFIIIEDFEIQKLLMPNAFSPNGDGTNDIFGPVYNQNPNLLEMTIFNRWGQTVFHTKDFNNLWDGQIKGKAGSSDVYVWILRAQIPNCKGGLKAFDLKGDVTLVR